MRRRLPTLRRIVPALALVAAGAAGLLLLLPGGPPERIVLVVIDTLRRDHLGSYGGAVSTPHIDALAERGQVFENYLASFHQTTMSMASLFTGRTPSVEASDTSRHPIDWNGSTWCGMLRFAETNDELCIPPGVPTLAEGLREAGYWTLGVASNQLLYEPSDFSRGFDDWVEVGEMPPGPGLVARFQMPEARESRQWKWVNRAAVEALNRRPSDRLFLYVHYMDVHDYGGAPEAYAAAVTRVDEAVGSLLRNLEQAELLDDSVVILTSDHGERLGERHALLGRSAHFGNPSFQEVLRLPLVIAPPTGRDSGAVLRSEDLFYLVQELAGLAPERAPVLRPGELFVGERRYRTYLSGRWKSTVRREDGKLHLFDLESDPDERRDVAKFHPEIAKAHRERIDELSHQLAAPRPPKRDLSRLNRERLRALGYLEDED